MSPLAPAFYPPGDCVESVLGKALDEVHLDDLDMGSLERELDKDIDANSVSSSISAGLSTSGCFSNNSSIPIGIPFSRIAQRGSIIPIYKMEKFTNLREELMILESKMAEWEGVYTQAKCACEAWKKEAEEANRKAKLAEEEKQIVLKQKEDISTQLLRVQQVIGLAGGPHIYALSRYDLSKYFSTEKFFVVIMWPMGYAGTLYRDINTFYPSSNSKFAVGRTLSDYFIK
ncbi:hypothetical protein Btru_035785 [Bulinus truncatus]|nr:hypothetical protein Btru_035785 [Bulinus truncatus]